MVGMLSKARGIIKKNIGFSTHSSPEAVKKAPKDVDIILASINEKYIDHGTLPEMLSALKKQKSKGIIAMKLLGAGKHVKEYAKRMKFATSLKFVDSYNVGMANEKDLRQNVKYFSTN